MRKVHAAAPPGRVDLNLLRLLRTVVETGSVSRAGEALGLSQPAASRAVGRLRAVLGDPLLVRTAKGYVLTPRAEALAGAVTAALDAADRVFRAEAFEPSSSERTFRLASTDYGALAVVTPLASLVAREAPAVRLEVDAWTEGTLAALESGALDMALYADGPIPDDFHYRDLYVERYVAVVRRGHPLLKRRVRGAALARALADYPVATARYPAGRSFRDDDALARLGAPAHRVTLAMPYFMAAPLAVGRSDRVMLLPQRAAAALAGPLGLIMLPLGGDPELRFAYRVIWHERTHRDPGARWLRDAMRRAVDGARASPS